MKCPNHRDTEIWCGFVLYIQEQSVLSNFLAIIKQRLGLAYVRVVRTKDSVKDVLFCTGSGAELIEGVSTDCFITGDLKYHTALQAYENGISLIDIGHFESERYFGECIAKALQKFQIEVIIKHSKNPFSYL